MKILTTTVLGCCSLLLCACASDPSRLPAGSRRDQALSSLGAPTARYQLADGERLQYSRQPLGYEVYDADFDRDGKLRSVTQVLDEAYFQRAIQPGVLHQDDVQRQFGAPSELVRVGDFKGEVWTYRYHNMNSIRFLNIYIDPDGVVRRFHSTDDLRGADGGTYP